MYKGFNLQIEFNQTEINGYYSIGQKIYANNQQLAENRLNYLMINDETIDGTKMQENWFPQINADVFLSHSHADELSAIVFAGYLSFTFGLTTFIDSGIWGYSNRLLKLIDNKYCRLPNGSYDYDKRNSSTSHVHMMLTTALSKMMDKTECLFFMNTPNSVTTKNQIDSTKSPWIYSEINISKIIKKELRRKYVRRETITFSKGGGLNGSINENIQYRLDLDHLTGINKNHIINWQDSYKQNSVNHPLDVLYSQHSLPVEFFK